MRALTGGGVKVPSPVVPSLVVLADPSPMVSQPLRERLAADGFTLRTVTGAGHVMHRDDYEGLLAALEGWI